MVNTVSAFYPIHSDGTCLTKERQAGLTNYDGYPTSTSAPASGTSCPCSRLTTSSLSAACSTAASSRRTRSTAASWRTSTAPTTAEPTGTAFPFTDVPASRWSYPYIKELYEAGVVSGTTATTFEPTGQRDPRAVRLTMLAGLAGRNVSAYQYGQFSDVPADAWYAPYVNWAAANRIVSGIRAPRPSPERDDLAPGHGRHAL